MKSIFLRYLVKIAQIIIPKHKTQNRILIVSTTALGDTLWATPAIESIRRDFPHCYLAVLTSKIGEEVLENNPYIDKLFLLKEPIVHSFFSLWKKLYKEKFDTVLLFHASQRLTLPLCALIGVSRIIGTAGINKGLDSLLTDRLPHHAQHEIVRRLKIVERIGVSPKTQKLSFFLKKASSTLKKGLWVAFHPGSKDAFRRWPKEKFIQLGCRLKKEMDCEILITGTEKELIKDIASQIPGAHINEEIQTLNDFAALLKEVNVLVTNDTGPVHLACALEIPVVAIYVPSSPALYGPYKAERAVAVSRRPSCDPCLKRKCRLSFCFLQIGVDEVYAQIEKLVKKKG